MQIGNLVAELAAKSELPPGKVNTMVKALIAKLSAEIQAGERTTVPGLGSFVSKQVTLKDNSKAKRIIFKPTAAK